MDAEPNVYRGQSGYKNFAKVEMHQVGDNKITGTKGPIRAPAFLRSSCRFDYQPDICKDYKETGVCGYGDQCKFLHDRGDYKSGWQLEKEWDAVQAKKKKILEESVASFVGEDGKEVDLAGAEEEENFEIDDSESLPFACHICRGDFVKPIMTVCNHYFCGACAMDHHRKTPKCAICDKQTFGIFNRAHKLIKKLESTGKLKKELTGVQRRVFVGGFTAENAAESSAANEALKLKNCEDEGGEIGEEKSSLNPVPLNGEEVKG